MLKNLHTYPCPQCERKGELYPMPNSHGSKILCCGCQKIYPAKMLEDLILEKLQEAVK